MSRLQPLTRRLRYHAAALALLLLLVGAIVLRINPPDRIASHLRGDDDYSVTYAISWGHHVLWSEPGLYFRMPILSAQDSPRFFTETGLLVQFLTVPLRLLGNPILSMHLVCMAGVLLSALAAYGAAFSILRNRLGAVGAAFVYACHGDMQYHLWSHPNIVAVFFIPVCLAIQHRLLRRPSWILALLQSLLVFLQFTCSIYLGVILMAGLGCCWLMELAIARRLRVARADAAILAGYAFTLGMAWIYTGPFRALSDAYGSQRGLGEAARYSAGFGGWFLPTTLGEFPKSIVALWLDGRIESASRLEDAQFLGWTAWACCLAMMALALRAWWRGDISRPQAHLLYLLPGVVVGFILSLGPFLWIGDHITSIRLPFYHLFTNIPALQFFRATSRFSILVAWVVAVGFGLSLRMIRHRAKGSWRRRGWPAAVLLILLFVELFPVRTQPFHPHPPEPAEALLRHPELRSVAPIPFADERFLIDSARTFPESPSGTWAGIYNPHYRALNDLIVTATDDHRLALLSELDTEAVLVYGEVEAARLSARTDLSLLERWEGGALLRLGAAPPEDAGKTRRELAALTTYPRLPASDRFPAHAPADGRWIPGNWQWLDDDLDPPIWKPFEWQRMATKGFVYHDLEQVFYDGLEPRPMAEVGEVHVRLSIKDPGVDYVESRVYWLTTADGGWTPEKSAPTWIHADGRWQVATFDLTSRPAWNPRETLTALQFEPTTTPHPGQRARISEIRLVPTVIPSISAPGQ